MSNAQAGTLSYYSWPIAIVVFFVVLAGFNIYLGIQAFQNHPDSVTESPYESGLVYQQTVTQLELAKSLGLKAEILVGALRSDGKRNIELLISSSEPASFNLVNAAKLRAIRPSSAKLDAQGVLSRVANGGNKFSGEIALSEPGFYQIEITLDLPAGSALIKDSVLIKS